MSFITLPADLLPADGRFGCGPSKIPQAAVDALAAAAPTLLGTSHRQAPVKDLVARLRAGLSTFFDLPAGYEVVLGNGGATAFWDAAVAGLITQRSVHAVFGEFSSKFAAAVDAAPYLDDAVVVKAAFGSRPELGPVEGADVYALTHCETSTGVAMPVSRPASDGLVLVDATSAAGGLDFDPNDCDAYYFSPQKGFASEGGLWIALMSPAAIARLDTVAATGRHIPASLDLRIAVDNSSKDQTYNTPSISTLFLTVHEIDALNAAGGLRAAVADCAAKSSHIYDWAQKAPYASPYVADPDHRSPVVTTIDIDDAIPAGEITKVLRAHGVVDIDAYRKLGRNQLRIATFPAVDLADVQKLTACVDAIVEQMQA